jgi:hypothetical protein
MSCGESPLPPAGRPGVELVAEVSVVVLELFELVVSGPHLGGKLVAAGDELPALHLVQVDLGWD